MTSPATRWNPDEIYRLFLQRDAANNGKFIIGVVTTGIYCLPSCPARRAKLENVRLFPSPAEAVASGLRPCLRCRPEYFYRGAEWHEHLYEETVARVRKEPAAFISIADLAGACEHPHGERGGVSDRAIHADDVRFAALDPDFARVFSRRNYELEG